MKWKAHLALLCVALIYGANYTIAKNVLDKSYLEPNGFILLRVFTGVVLFSLMHVLFVKEKIDYKDIKLLALCGLFGVAINQMFFFKGLALTSPVHASLIMVTTPIIVLIASSIYIHEGVNRMKVIGIALGMIGAMLLISYGKEAGDQLASALGDVYVLINAVSYGIYLVIVKRLMEKYNAITVMKWVFSFGLLYVVPFGVNDLIQTDWQNFPNEIILAIAYVLIFTTFLAYLLNAYALSIVFPTTASAYVYLQPIIASTVAILFYGDQLSVVKIISAVLIFAGVYLISFGNSKQTQDQLRKGQ